MVSRFSEEGRHSRRMPVAQVAVTFNQRAYRFECDDADVARLDTLTKYLTDVLDRLMQQHGPVGDERLVLMAALTLADELFDARADIDELLDAQPDTQLRTVAEPANEDTAA